MKAKLAAATGGTFLVLSVTASGAEPEGLSRAVQFAGKFHPLAVHFPIALILAAVLAEAMLILTRRRGYSDAGHFCVVVGAFGVFPAVVLGMAAAAQAGYSGSYAETLSQHRLLGFALGVLAPAAALLSGLVRRENASPRLVWIYRALLIASAALIGVVGHLGATLVYGHDFLKW